PARRGWTRARPAFGNRAGRTRDGRSARRATRFATGRRRRRRREAGERVVVCGIVGVVQGESGRDPVPLDELFAEINAAHATLPFDTTERIAACTTHVERVDSMLRGVRGIVTLARN